MIRLLNKIVYPEKSTLLREFALSSQADLDCFECASGTWRIENGSLVGRFRENGGGICYTKESFPGDIFVEFQGTMLAPCCNDLNFVIKSEGWNYEKNDAGRGFIGGLNGWYDQKAGFEKYPLCKTQALAPFAANADQEYEIQAGYCRDTVFLAVDGKLVVEMHDPNPEEFAGFGRIGLGTYCSQIRFRNLRILRPTWVEIEQSYTPAF